MKINEKHLLVGDNITQLKCKKNTKKFATKLPDTIVIHYTAGRSGESSANYLCRDNVKASAHIVIDRSGKIHQLVPFDIKSWHAGKSAYEDRKGLNQYSIGIEIDNAGVLKKIGNRYQAWFGKYYNEEDVIRAVHRNERAPKYWHTYSEEQMDKCYEICEELIAHYGIKTILGHEEISPGRKQDPGPAFPLDKFRDKLLFNHRDEEEGVSLEMEGTVTASTLNIRSGPSTTYDKIADPLKDNQQVEILEEENGWLKVKTSITGWVSKDYIDIK